MTEHYNKRLEALELKSAQDAAAQQQLTSRLESALAETNTSLSQSQREFLQTTQLLARLLQDTTKSLEEKIAKVVKTLVVV
jgi:hypothetical protein